MLRTTLAALRALAIVILPGFVAGARINRPVSELRTFTGAFGDPLLGIVREAVAITGMCAFA